MQQILLFRELEFPLKDIKKIIGSPDFDRSKALGQQIELLELKKEHIEYAAQAKASWGKTPAYKEFEEKSKDRSKEEDLKVHRGLIDILAELGAIRETVLFPSL